ncbi:MAG: MCE family protein [Thiotrichales bacterium]|jgi:paraquat-inducible protein B|nr:MCE family protein [Thiotrichales bacterium]
MTDEVVTAKIIRHSRQWSLIWLVPLLALSIASYIGYQAWRSQGIHMTVLFDSATGIEVGKTQVRYKEVVIGKVSSVGLSDDLTKVAVDIAIDRRFAKQLHDNARFWVVRPRVTTRTISGLSTLLSGAYIAMTPGDTGDMPERVVGLDDPPTLSGASNGRQFTLTADRLGSMDVGSPVFYRGIAVGEVVSYTLGDDDRMRIHVFIRSPYDRLVKNNTRFWNVNGVELSMNGDGIKARMESLLSFMQGGVAFENVDVLDDNNANHLDSDLFELYPNKDSIKQSYPKTKLTYVMPFTGSVAGLSEGAKVQMQGLDIGQVIDFSPHFDSKTLKIDIPVLVEIWPERLAMPNDAEKAQQLFSQMMKQGLRAQLKPINLLTGQSAIDISYHNNAPVFVASTNTHNYPIFPTMPADIEQIGRSVSGILAQLDQAPIKETISLLRDSAQGLRSLLDEKRKDSVLQQTEQLLKQTNATLANLKDLPNNFNATLLQTQKTLATLDTSLQKINSNLGDDALLQHDLRLLMEETAKAANAVETLADTLQRQPNAVIFGKSQP